MIYKAPTFIKNQGDLLSVANVATHASMLKEDIYSPLYSQTIRQLQAGLLITGGGRFAQTLDLFRV